MATKQFHDTVTGSDVLRKRVKTVGVAMRNACEPYTVLHLTSEQQEGKRLENGANETADTYSYC